MLGIVFRREVVGGAGIGVKILKNGHAESVRAKRGPARLRMKNLP
jgi:hypothetical protein